jgi:hypothetical protein
MENTVDMTPPNLQCFAVNVQWSVVYFAAHIRNISVEPVSTKKISARARTAGALNAMAVLKRI